MKIRAVPFRDFGALRTVTLRVCKQLGCPPSWIKSVTYLGSDDYPTGYASESGAIEFRMPHRKLFPIPSIDVKGAKFPAYRNQKAALAAVLAHEVMHVMISRQTGGRSFGLENAAAWAEYFILRPETLKKVYEKVCVRFD